LRFETVAPGSELLEEVFALGEAEKAFLGWLTPAAWLDYAKRGRLLAAVQDGPDGVAHLAGYIAFRTTRDQITLAHLVVAPPFRGRGVARALLDDLTARYPRVRGIRAKCRSDYPANTMWPQLNFVPLGEVRGRGDGEHVLTLWWRDHGHAHLMSWDGAPADEIPVVIDANIFIALHGDDSSAEAADTRRTMELLSDRVQLLITPEVFTEINRNQDRRECIRLRAIAHTYPALSTNAVRVEELADALRAHLKLRATSQQDASDIKHVAYAAAAGISIFATKDEPALRKLGAGASEVLAVDMVTPADLFGIVDERESSPAYWPAAVLGTGYSVAESGLQDGKDMDAFLDTAGGEKARAFKRELRRLVSQRPHSTRVVFRDPSGIAVGLVGAQPALGVLEVSLFRLRDSSMRSTLAAQFVAHLRVIAREFAVAVIKVTDPHVTPFLKDALHRDAFFDSEGLPVGLTMNTVTKTAETAAAMERTGTPLTSADRLALEPLFGEAREYVRNPTASAALALERAARPLRIVDAPTTNWLVPIRPTFSTALFGYPDELFLRDDALGMSLEHVYYRGGKSGEAAPARVLWRVSGPHHGEVIGLSELLEVVDGPWKEVFKVNRRLGTYTHTQVRDVAKGRQVRALRVTNTSLFHSPVTFKQLMRLADHAGQRLVFRGPARLSAEMFEAIVAEGSK
jgi:predicted nucleic acid-binding protein/GNAT superfamily N-acetyltransferase